MCLIMNGGVSSPVGGSSCAGGRAGVGPLPSEEAPGSGASRQRTLRRLRRGVAEVGVLPSVRPIRPFAGRPVAPLPVAPQPNLHQAGVLRGRGVVGDVHNFRHHQGSAVHGD